MAILSHATLLLEISEQTGAITRLQDRSNKIEFINRAFVNQPFALQRGDDLVCEFDHFQMEHHGNHAALHWYICKNMILHAEIELSADGAVRFFSRVENGTEEVIPVYEYPIISGIQQIAREDCLIHSYATGIMIHNPLSLADEQMAGLRFIPYPESFSGASMQFLAYYGEQTGGLYVAAEDGDYHPKWLNSYLQKSHLTLSLMAGNEDVRPGNEAQPLQAAYPFVVRLLSGHPGWTEAADLYKTWAVQQPWCADGTLTDHTEPERPDWLYRQTGLATFGINARHDRSAWLNRYSRDIQTSIFHILGPDWTRVPQTFGAGVPGGYDDWFPTDFAPENLAAIRQTGSHYAPFEFDFLVDPTKADHENLKANLIRWPKQVYSHDRYTFNMLCPLTSYTRDFHIRRDVQVWQEAAPDSFYYDISANNLLRCCMAKDHGHLPGAGREMTLAYKDIYRETRAALSAAAGHAVPLGTEMMNEVFLPELDYYQARAWGQPSSTLETWPVHPLMKSGQAEMIPLFTYVYHEYGAVRLDGWGKLVEETGSLFYDIVAKTYLWGGLYEINHEYSPMEELDGQENSAEKHYYHFKPHHYAYSQQRADYVRQFAALRTGIGSPYLGFGVMRPAPAIDVPVVKLDWFHYNHSPNDTYHDRGEMTLASVRVSAWRRTSHIRGYALLFANVDCETHTIEVKLSPEIMSCEGIGEDWLVDLHEDFDPVKKTTVTRLGTAHSLWPDGCRLNLAPRKVYMLELKP